MNMFDCGYCNKSFNSENGRDNHTASVHGASSSLQNPGMVRVNKSEFDYLLKQLEILSYEVSKLSKEQVPPKIVPQQLKIVPQKPKIVPQKLKIVAPYPCTFQKCSKEFQSKAARTRHFQAVHSASSGTSGSFSCPSCSLKFKSLNDLENHQKTLHGVQYQLPSVNTKLLMCKDCSKSFVGIKDLDQHKLDKHPSQQFQTASRLVYKDVKLTENLSCRYCLLLFNSATDLKQHIISKHNPFKSLLSSSPSSDSSSITQKAPKPLLSPAPSSSTAQKAPKPIQSPSQFTALLTCKDCHRQFETLRQLLQHGENKHNNKFICDFCLELFEAAKDLEHHKMSKHAAPNLLLSPLLKLLICPYCSQKFPTSAQLLQHKQSKHMETLVCSFCSQQFNSAIDLEQHRAIQHVPKTVQVPVLTCRGCPQQFQTWAQLLQHREAKHKQIYPCNFCDEQFNTSIDMEQHRSAKHGPAKIVQASLICKDCSREFETSAQLLQHMETKHKKSFTCGFCFQVFKAGADLDQHTLIKHRVSKTVQTPVVTCTYCSQTFETSSQLLQHTEAKHKVTFVCTVCEVQFNSAASLDQHKLMKHGAAVASINYCTLCSQDFGSAAQLLQHTDAKHKNFVCGFCLQSFSTTNELEQHKTYNHRSPNKIPPKAVNSVCCSDCSENFGTVQQLLQHKIMKHTKFVCNSCLRNFNDSKDLEEHKVKEHGLFQLTQPLNEEISTIVQPNVKSRKSVHNTLVCKYCFADIFIGELSLKQHLQNVHHVKCNLDEYLSNDGASNNNKTFPSVTNKLPVICHYCAEQFTAVVELQQHYEDVHKYIDFFPCQNCDKVFLNESDRNAHISSHVSMCGYCYKQFSHANDLKRHKETVHRDVDYFPCSVCDDIFTSNVSRKKHIDQLHTVTCRYCFKTFHLDSHLKQHEENKHKNVDFFPCDICNQVFSSDISRKDHNNDVHNVKCDYCTRTFTKIEHLKQHEADKHENVECFSCDSCNKVFSSVIALNEHSEDVHNIRCGYCLSTFIDTHCLKQHLDNKHKNVEFFPCDRCNQIFSSEILRKKHSDTIHPTMCGYCSKFFSTIEDLKQHEADKHVEIFPCDACSDTFSSAILRKNHIDAVHKVKCGYCSKPFNKIEDLKQHESNKHINAGYFPCDACSEIFSSAISRKIHVDAGVHKVKCNYCLKTFNTVEHLKQHETDKHKSAGSESSEDRFVQCNYCTNKFDDNNLLKEHEEGKHRNIDYFPCDYCSEIFFSNISRRKHHSMKHTPNKSKSNSPTNEASNSSKSSSPTNEASNASESNSDSSPTNEILISSESFVCLHCVDHFRTNNDLENHLKEMHKREEESRRIDLLDGIYSAKLQQQMEHTKSVLRQISETKRKN